MLDGTATGGSPARRFPVSSPELTSTASLQRTTLAGADEPHRVAAARHEVAAAAQATRLEAITAARARELAERLPLPSPPLSAVSRSQLAGARSFAAQTLLLGEQARSVDAAVALLRLREGANVSAAPVAGSGLVATVSFMEDGGTDAPGSSTSGPSSANDGFGGGGGGDRGAPAGGGLGPLLGWLNGLTGGALGALGDGNLMGALFGGGAGGPVAQALGGGGAGGGVNALLEDLLDLDFDEDGAPTRPFAPGAVNGGQRDNRRLAGLLGGAPVAGGVLAAASTQVGTLVNGGLPNPTNVLRDLRI